MNTQPPRQHEALSDEERELARVVRALPGGEPPAALDALILKAATDAVASSHSQKKSRWTKSLLGTSALWMGTAAASILTIGIGWQVFQSMGAPIDELPDSENVMSKQETDSSHKSDSITVEMIPAREPTPTSPPPPLAESESTADAAADFIEPVEKPAVMPSEKRARKAMVREEIADASLAKKTNDDKFSARRDQARAEADWVPQTAGALASVAAPAPAPIVAAAPAPPPAPAALANYSDSKELDAVAVTGSRIKRADSESSQPAQVLSRQTIDKTKAREAAKSDKANLGASQEAKNNAPIAAAGTAAKASAPAIAADTASDNQALERIEVTGSRIKPDYSQAYPVAVISQKQIDENKKKDLAEDAARIKLLARQDAKLAPDLWLAAIQKHVKEKDIALAKASLKLFKKTHRNIQIPKELKPLLK